MKQKTMNLSKYLRRALLALVLTVSLVIPSGLTAFASDAADYDGWDTLKVFETTDVHGYITDVSTYDEDTFQYRLAYIANIVNEARAELGEDNVILLDGGDIYQSTPHSNRTYGNYIRYAYDVMGYDAVALGNHEFDWDVQKYAVDLDGTMASYTTADGEVVDPTIPVVMANLYDAKTDDRVDFTQEYIVVEKGGYKVAIVGWTDEYTADIKASQIEPYTIGDDIEYLNSLIDDVEANEQPDIMMVLTHGAPDGLAEQLNPEVVDLVCGGHTHLTTCGTADNGIDYIQGNNKALGYATAEIKINPDTKEVDVVNPVYTSITDDKTLLYYNEANKDNLDADIVKISQEAWDEVKGDMYEVLATVDTNINKNNKVEGALSSTTGGNWITELMRLATKEYNTVTAFANSGGIRCNIELQDGKDTRDITAADIYTISPFGNKILVYSLTGKQLAKHIEMTIVFEDENTNSYQYYPTNWGEQFSGITVTYERDGVNIKVVSIVTDDGEIIDPTDETKTYNVAVNEYGATLGQEVNGVYMDSVFKNLTPIVAADEAPVDNESFIAALRERKDTEGLFMEVDTTAHLKEDDGEAAACKEMTELLAKVDTYANATKEDKAALEALVADIQALVAGGKLTDAQVAILEETVADLNKQIAALDKAEGSTTPEGDKPSTEGDKPATEGNKPAPEGDKPSTEGNKPATEGNKPATEGNKPATEANKPSTGVQTGDSTNIMLWVALMAVCGIVFVGTKKRCREN